MRTKSASPSSSNSAVDAQGCSSDGKVYRALVRNRAQLAYNSVGAWLEKRGPAPPKVAVSSELAAQLQLQDEAAQRMVGSRFQHGALDLETIETHPVMEGSDPIKLARLEKNRATSLIEEFMVAANGVMARAFDDAKVRLDPPHRAHAQALGPHRRTRRPNGHKLPAQPDSKALNDFLLAQKAKDPDHFP